jgi:acetoin utilization deacetylase AcuC-like enzyme
LTSDTSLGFNINVPLSGPKFGDWEYVETWEKLLLPVLRSFDPDLVVISAGFDAALGDPLGGMVRLSTQHSALILSQQSELNPSYRCYRCVNGVK